jgi:hypothetical protein
VDNSVGKAARDRPKSKVPLASNLMPNFWAEKSNYLIYEDNRFPTIRKAEKNWSHQCFFLDSSGVTPASPTLVNNFPSAA